MSGRVGPRAAAVSVSVGPYVEAFMDTSIIYTDLKRVLFDELK